MLSFNELSNPISTPIREQREKNGDEMDFFLRPVDRLAANPFSRLVIHGFVETLLEIHLFFDP